MEKEKHEESQTVMEAFLTAGRSGICEGAVMHSTYPTVYLMDIDNEATVVIAKNIAEAMDKAEKISKISYKMIYSKSLPLL